MNKIKLSLYYRLPFFLVLFLGQNKAIGVDTADIAISQYEYNEIINNEDKEYIYLTTDIGSIYKIMEEMSTLDDDHFSIIHQLKNYIEHGYSIGEVQEVLKACLHAKKVLKKQWASLPQDMYDTLYRTLKDIIHKIINKDLIVHKDSLKI